MSEYRKKPVVVDAMQLIDDLRNHTKIATWITVNGGDVDVPFAEPCLYVETPEGRARAEIGDWIVKGAKGEFRTCDPITFEATYEPAAQQPQPAPDLRTAWRLLGEARALLDHETRLTWQSGLPGERARVAVVRESAGLEALT